MNFILYLSQILQIGGGSRTQQTNWVHKRARELMNKHVLMAAVYVLMVMSFSYRSTWTDTTNKGSIWYIQPWRYNNYRSI